MEDYLLMQPESPRHIRKRGGRNKPFAIESRFIRQSACGIRTRDTWSIWRRYETERDRDRALEALRRSKSVLLGKPWMEFRPINLTD